MAPSPLALASAVLLLVAIVYQYLSPYESPSLTLTYFDAPGRAEASRVALRLGGVAFTDERLARDAFLQLKPTLPFGQVPVLTVDGETFAESQAILRYAGRLAGLYPRNNGVATLLVDEILTAVDEVNEIHITPTRREKDLAKQKLMRETACAGPLPASLEKLDARVKAVAELPFFKQFIDQDRIFLHEIAVWRLVSTFQSATLDHIPPSIADVYTTLNAVHSKVEAAISKLPVAPRSRAGDAGPLAQPKSLKVTYFDFTGRAEPIRLALHIGNVGFEDERLERDAFLELKPTLPYGQVPVLTVDGHYVAAQTFALLRYAGSLAGLYPLDDPVEALKIDEIIARVEDVYYAFYPSGKETDQDKKRVLREQLAAERLPQMLALLEKRVAQHKGTSTFVLGDAITVADLAVFNLVQFFKSGNVDFVSATIVDAHKTLLDVNEAVLNHPRVVDWYKHSK